MDNPAKFLMIGPPFNRHSHDLSTLVVEIHPQSDLPRQCDRLGVAAKKSSETCRPDNMMPFNGQGEFASDIPLIIGVQREIVGMMLHRLPVIQAICIDVECRIPGKRLPDSRWTSRVDYYYHDAHPFFRSPAADSPHPGIHRTQGILSGATTLDQVSRKDSPTCDTSSTPP